MIEIWKPITGYEGWYSVSSLGRIRREKSHRGNFTSILKNLCISDRYYRVVLWKDSKRKHKYVHLLVAEAFIGPKPKGYDCNHKDGDKSNCRLSNLEYITSTENARHAWRTGLYKKPCGIKNPAAKLTEKEVLEIREKHSKGICDTRLAKEYGVHHSNIYLIVTRKKWKHI